MLWTDIYRLRSNPNGYKNINKNKPINEVKMSEEIETENVDIDYLKQLETPKSVRELTVFYKYVATMTIIKKSFDSFKTSVREKVVRFLHPKSSAELHVCPFLEYQKGIFYYQPMFDFDKGVKISEIKRFVYNELFPFMNRRHIALETSINGFHVITYKLYGPFTKEMIDKLRKIADEKYKKTYKHLDVTTSIRLMPMRRTPSFVVRHNRGYRIYPILWPDIVMKYQTERTIRNLQKQKTVLTEREFYHIVDYRLVPGLMPIKNLFEIKERHSNEDYVNTRTNKSNSKGFLDLMLSIVN